MRLYTHAHTHGHSKERGITLIALVVTIVVLLILAGVSINLVLGNNGIISKAKESRTETRMSQIDEQVKLAIGDAYADGIGSITDSGLKSALNNRLGEGTYDISGDETTGWKVTVKETGKTYDITANGDTGSSEESGTTVDWDAILEDAKKNPEKYKDENQSGTNGDIGIGTDGLPVNMDWWNARIINENEIALGNYDGCGFNVGYSGDIIDGKIVGKVPEYVKKAGKDEFYKVTSLEYAFAFTDLVIAPELPSGVTNMMSTFISCEKLEKAPKIPNSVTNMSRTFYECTSLTSAPEIPNSVTDMSSTFNRCTSLTTAPKIPDGVTSMNRTFTECRSLAIVSEIPEGVEDMALTFCSCVNLTTAPTIPSSVTNISGTFYGCEKLTGVVVVNPKKFIANGGCGYFDDKNGYTACFSGTKLSIMLKGTSPYLTEIAATATNGNVTVQTTSE